MTIAHQFVTRMTAPDAWDESAIHRASEVDRSHTYDKVDVDLAFFYFTDGSSAGTRPRSHQVWEVKP